ncbi:hypothetical protein [Vulcaniibacterium tengchongense]|uniref:Secreted protein n=1 Tax=Vulcaniibacterium tengchongense TaxID=1273429 RepID=A0A3N4VRV8_9GAMM|nr:hypothetical protein [Vulcaniibacterium tengchongense]RPE75784.1 hypothetical protein EDC50_2679 [Vulcaniibacterium tengchongense]
MRCRVLSVGLLLPAWLAAAPALAGVEVRACRQDDGAARKIVGELSCGSAVDCPIGPDGLSLRAADGAGEWPVSDPVFVDETGRPLDEPPMRGTIRALWRASLPAADAPDRLQLYFEGRPVGAPFVPGEDCSALPRPRGG